MLAAPLARSQQPSKVYRIGFLGAASPTPEFLAMTLDPVRRGMRELGWIDGQHYVLVARWGEGRPERLPDHAEELVRLGVDVMIAGNTTAIRAAMRATKRIPIVMALPNNPVRDGLIANFARPGGNVTGMTLDADLGSLVKQVDYLRQVIPGISRIGMLSNPDARFGTEAEFQAAIPKVGLQLVVAYARAPEQIESAFAKMKSEGAQAVLLHPDGMLTSQRMRICELAIKHRLPLTSNWTGFALAGALMSYGADWADNYRRTAAYTVKILRGAKPRELPVERPVKFDLAVNVKTAKVLGLTVPQSILLQAAEVIE